jgi:hypothetical protein
MSELLRAIPEARLVTHEDTCKGLIFRASVKSYINGGNIIVRKHLNLLKRKSCAGCERCGWILDADNLPEYINYFTNQDVLEKLKHGQLYTVSISGGGRDYWGEYDDIDYDFVEYNEESEVRGD